VPFKENVTLKCESPGRTLRGSATSGFRQCVYDPKPVIIKHIFYNNTILLNF